jgi:hypothetical protein
MLVAGRGSGHVVLSVRGIFQERCECRLFLSRKSTGGGGGPLQMIKVYTRVMRDNFREDWTLKDPDLSRHVLSGVSLFYSAD